MRKLLLQSLLLQLPLTERAPTVEQAHLAELAQGLGAAARRRLGRSLSIREVDAGSCNGCELEIHALANAYYDLERFGLRFVASPRHADVLLVTGPVTRNMRQALERTYAATPDPEVGGGRGRLRRQLRRLRRQLRLRRPGRLGHPRRPPHPRLPANAHRPPQRADRPGGSGRPRGAVGVGGFVARAALMPARRRPLSVPADRRPLLPRQGLARP